MENRFHQEFYTDSDGTKRAISAWHMEAIDVLKEVPRKTRAALVGFDPVVMEELYTEIKKDLENEVCDILSKKWISRETSTKLVLAETEFQELNWISFKEIKRRSRLGRLTCRELMMVVEYFEGIDCEWRVPD